MQVGNVYLFCLSLKTFAVYWRTSKWQQPIQLELIFEYKLNWILLLFFSPQVTTLPDSLTVVEEQKLN